MFAMTRIFLSQQRFCCDKHTFVTTKDVFCCDKHTFVTTEDVFCCDKHSFVTTKDVFCCDKHMFVVTNVFVATKIILAAVSASDIFPLPP